MTIGTYYPGTKSLYKSESNLEVSDPINKQVTCQGEAFIHPDTLFL